MSVSPFLHRVSFVVTDSFILTLSWNDFPSPSVTGWLRGVAWVDCCCLSELELYYFLTFLHWRLLLKGRLLFWWACFLLFCILSILTLIWCEEFSGPAYLVFHRPLVPGCHLLSLDLGNFLLWLYWKYSLCIWHKILLLLPLFPSSLLLPPSTTSPHPLLPPPPSSIICEFNFSWCSKGIYHPCFHDLKKYCCYDWMIHLLPPCL